VDFPEEKLLECGGDSVWELPLSWWEEPMLIQMMMMVRFVLCFLILQETKDDLVT